MKLAPLLTVIFAAAACTTTGAVNTSLSGFVGKPAKVAFGVYGFPQSERTIADRKVYIWTASPGLNCTMRMMADQADIVRETEAKGVEGQCYQFNKAAP